ncbi:cupin-like domain-containing protein [Aestuariivivens sediminis]|uniref:cupin-like domain-containing protein n=1 Tax=Aestuariivivens sediminis TaxID=2913557 RepID=UPI001F57163F|nr:cupin-like domain-containing protein [Aestuariivivens sediminis]
MVRTHSFRNIIGYKETVPTCQLSSNIRMKWASSFLFNFIFRKNQTQHFEEMPSEHGGAPKRLQQRIHDEFLLKNTEEFNSILPLPEVAPEHITPKEFARWRKQVNMPIVLRGFIKNSKACQTWSIPWLSTHFGDQTVQCIPPDISSFLGEEVKLQDLSVKDFCTLKAYENYYINNHHSLFGKTDFYDSCEGRRIEALRGTRHVVDQWFISRSTHTGTSLHCANGDNMFLNIKGRKEWHFIHPSYTPLLSPLVSKYGTYAVAGVEKSLLNQWDAITDTYPYFKRIPVYKVVLQEGDVLFNPPWWWHSVRNLDPFTLGCATRYLAPGKASNVPVFHVCQVVEALRHPIKSVYPQTLYMLFFKGVNKGLLNSIFSKT